VPLMCVGQAPLDLGALATSAGASPLSPLSPANSLCEGRLTDASAPPVGLTLWRVDETVSSVKHVFVLVNGETSLAEAYRTLMRAAGRVTPQGGAPTASAAAAADDEHAPLPVGGPEGGSPLTPERERASIDQMLLSAHGVDLHSVGMFGRLDELRTKVSSMMAVGGDAMRQLRSVAKKTDHVLSRGGWSQSVGLCKLLERAIRREAAGEEAAMGEEEDEDDESDDDDVRALLAAGRALSGVSHHPEDSTVDTGSLVSLLLRAQAVWSSPLARCVQTALLSLRPILAGRALELKSNAREQRLISNLHTSIGNSMGQHIHTRCVSKLRELCRDGGETERVNQTDRQRIDSAEAECQWWSTNPEPAKEYEARIGELLTQIQYSQHDTIVLSTHNDTLQELLRHHIHEDARDRRSQLLQQLCPGPAPPCSLIWLGLDFRNGASTPITDVALLGFSPTLFGQERR
jgi:broad specificity phosphatase PhoE